MFNLKQYISIALTTLLLFSIVWQTVIVADFYLNREQITEEFCINKDKPELNCKGQCHLTKQLDTRAKSTTKIQVNQNVIHASKIPLVLFVYAQLVKRIEFSSFYESKLTTQLNIDATKGFNADIFDPPQFS